MGKTWRIWREGWSVQGNGDETARLLGTVEAETFQEACDAHFAIRENDPSGYYESDRLTLWGCHLYDNETDARRVFG